MCNKSKEIQDFDSLYELVEFFRTESDCIDYLANIRWNGNPVCPHCEGENVYEFNRKERGKNWKCANKECKKQFSVRVGTIFEESRLPLRKWFIAIWMFTAHKKGISSHQLSRDLKITQKTAWFMLHRIRVAFTQKPEEAMGYEKELELDHTFVGGKDENRHKNKRVGYSRVKHENSKIPVLGIVERGGNVYALKCDNTKNETTLPIVKEVVSEGATIYTDNYRGFRRLRDEYKHEAVDHTSGEYVKGSVHTNTIESFWAIVKRTIYGIYHQTSDVHLQSYINECTFRFNYRLLNDASRFDVMLSNSDGRLTYEQLKNERYRQAG